MVFGKASHPPLALALGQVAHECACIAAGGTGHPGSKAAFSRRPGRCATADQAALHEFLYMKNSPSECAPVSPADIGIRSHLKAYLELRSSPLDDSLEVAITDLLVLLRHLYYTDFAELNNLDTNFGILEEVAFKQWAEEDGPLLGVSNLMEAPFPSFGGTSRVAHQ